MAEGFDVAVEHSGEGAFFRISTEPIDLILLDVGLPGRSGLEVLRASSAPAISPSISPPAASNGRAG